MKCTLRHSLACGLLTLALCLATSTTAIGQKWTRAVSFGGTGSDEGTDIRITKSGDRYLTGYFSNSVTFGKKTLTSVGGHDIYLAKFGKWVVQIGGSGDDAGYTLALDADENLYLCGWFTDAATFHSTKGRSVTATGDGQTTFLAKYTSAGVLEWVETGVQSGPDMDMGRGIAVDDKAGAVYITGYTQGDTTFSSANGESLIVPGPWYWHMYLVKYDKNGNVQWGVSDSASPNSQGVKVAVDAAGNVYAVGWFEGVDTFHSADGNDQTIVGLSGPVQGRDYPGDGFVAKYDANGNLKWVNDVGGYKCYLMDITINPSGVVSVTGLIGNIDGNPQQQETLVLSQPPGQTINLGGGIFTNPYNLDVVVVNYDESGVALSAQRIGGAGNEQGYSMVGQGDDLYILEVLNDSNEIGVIKLTNGSLDWILQGGAGAITYTMEPRLALAPNGRVILTGPFVNTATFGPYTLTSHGSSDVFLVNLAP
jgi:hypothetical protein